MFSTCLNFGVLPWSTS